MSNNVTTNEAGQPTATPQPKVIAAAGGAGVGAAVTTLVIYLIESIGKFDLPGEVEGAALVIVSTLLSFAAGYIKRPSGIN